MIKKKTEKKTGDKKSIFNQEIVLIYSASAEEIVVLTKQWAMLMKAGMTMEQTINVLMRDMKNLYLKKKLEEIKVRIKEGVSFVNALRLSKLFSDFYISMIKVGDASGSITEIMEELGKILETESKVKSKLVYVMIYPFILLFVALIVVTIILTVVVPKISKVFLEANVDLPQITKYLIYSSDFLMNHYVFVFIGIGLFFLFMYLILKIHLIKCFWDKIQLRLPILGSILQNVFISRFALTLYILDKNGTVLLKSLYIIRDVVDNEEYKKEIDDLISGVKKGYMMGFLLRNTKVFPLVSVSMISAGELSNSLTSMLKYIGEVHTENVMNKVDLITKTLEPIMILFIGGIIGLIVFSVLLPIINMSTLIK